MPQTIDNMSVTWTNSLTTYTGIKLNAAGSSDANSAAGSLLMDLQMGGTSRFKVNKASQILFGGATGDSAFNEGIYASNWLSLGGTNNSTVVQLRSNIVVLSSSAIFCWANNTSFSSQDLILTRRAAANLRLGAADTTGTTAPTAQTLSVQSWTSSTNNNQPGANFTIAGSQGTGTGAGGSIIFQVAPAGAVSNGVQNALATALTINSARQLLAETSSDAAPAFAFSGATGTGLSVRGSVGRLVAAGTPIAEFTSGEFRLGGSQYFSWASNTSADPGAASDVRLYRDAANTLALRNGANAQTFRVYNTYTSDTNYESGRLQWVGNEFRVGPETVGGTLRSMGLYVGGTRYQIIGSNFNQFDQNIYMNVANIVTDTSTGFKIGTGTTQKIGFWNATPIAQPTTAVAAATVAATGTGDVVAASTTFDGYTIPQIVKALRNAGLLA